MRAALAAFLAALVCGGCITTTTCTNIERCSNSVTVKLDPPVPFEAGYGFAFTYEGMTVRCNVLDDGSGTPVCSQFEHNVLVVRGVDGVGRVQLLAKPAQITIQILHEGAVLRETTLSPAYIEFRPNGEDCDPVCSIAELTL